MNYFKTFHASLTLNEMALSEVPLKALPVDLANAIADHYRKQLQGLDQNCEVRLDGAGTSSAKLIIYRKQSEGGGDEEQ